MTHEIRGSRRTCTAARRADRRTESAFRAVLLLAACVLLFGCKIVIVSGPTVVAIGETVVYVLEVSSDTASDFDRTPVVVADAPLGWQLVSSTYTRTIAGVPVSGNGVAVAFPACAVGVIPPGYQRWGLEPEMPVEGLNAAGSGEVTLEFLVTDQPSGEYEINFTFGSDSECSPPAVATINRRGPSYLAFLQALFDDTDGVDGLNGPAEVTASPAGRHLYVAGALESSVAAFSRDEASGALTFTETEVDGVGGVAGMAVPRGVAVSPDERFLYVASLSDFSTGDQGGIAVFARDPATGELAFVERLLEDVESLAVSPDGRHLYAAAAAITVYSRDQTSGELTFVETTFPGGRLLMAPDGRHLYAWADSSSAFSRDELSGRLTFLHKIFATSAVVALSPDGRHFYNSFRVYERDLTTGHLGPPFNNPTGLRFSIQPESVAVSPEGGHVIVGGVLGMFVYQRNKVTGELTLAESHYPFNLPAIELEGPRSLTFAPGSRHLYATSFGDDALLAFETSLLFHDGFESGTAAAWSATVP